MRRSSPIAAARAASARRPCCGRYLDELLPPRGSTTTSPCSLPPVFEDLEPGWPEWLGGRSGIDAVEERHDAFVHRACPQDLSGRHCRDRANGRSALIPP